jgi:hypothetical protein
MSLPLTIRKNIRDSEPKLKEHLEKINNVTGKEWSFEADWAKLVAAEAIAPYKDQVGSMLQDELMRNLAENLDRLCKSESTKEAFLEATGNSKIVFRHNPKQASYWAVLFENGDLVVEFKQFANTHELSYFNITSVIPTPGLPLPVRLNIEKSREQMDAALEKIGDVTGEKDWAFEADYEKIVAVVDKHTAENIGSLYAEIVSNFAGLLANKLKDDTIKESFNEATTQHKIVIRVNDKAPDYFTLQFNNGEIIIEHKKSIANMHITGQFPIEKLIPSPGGLSLVQRLNIQKAKPNVDEELEKLKNVTGEEWSLEADYEKSVKDFGKENQYAADSVGETYYEVLKNIVDNISRLVKQGDTVKEAFLEATPERKIVVQLNDKIKDYWVFSFKNGGLLIEHKKSIANIHTVGYTDLKPLIPSPGGLSLVTRVNIEKNKENIDECLQEIAKAAGTEDWTFEPDYEKAAKELDKNTIDSIGDLYTEALKGIKENIVRNMQKEAIKEAFNEATAERKIIIRVNDKCPDYWKFKFENGSILLEHKKSIANMHTISYQDIPEALPVPGVLTLVARLNISDNKEQLDNALERIKNATGEEYTFDDACLEEVFKKLPEVKNNIGGFIYGDIMKGIADLIEKNMKDEMVKEAFNEISTGHQITVRIDPKQGTYWLIKFENGNLVVSGKAYCNIHEVANLNLEKLL